MRLGGRLGIDEPALLGALTHGSAESRVLSMIARPARSTFISAVGEFIGKDVAVVRKTVAELGGDLGRSTPSSTPDFGGKTMDASIVLSSISVVSPAHT